MEEIKKELASLAAYMYGGYTREYVVGRIDKIIGMLHAKPASPPSMPDLETCKDKVLEIIQKNYNEFKGTNEAELHSSHEIANWMCSQCEGLIKQKAVEFAEWCKINMYGYVRGFGWIKHHGSKENITTEELYEIFNQQER